MAEVIYGTPEIFASIAGGSGRTSERLRGYINDRRESLSKLSDHGRRFHDMARERFHDYGGSILKRARAISRTLDRVFAPDIIRALNSIEDVQNPPDRMINYLMSHRKINKLYRDNGCSGYGSRYKPPEPDIDIGETEHYRMVVNGMLTYNDDGVWEASTRSACTDTPDNELTFEEQIDVITAWEIMDLAIAKSEDPTDIYGGDL